VATAALKYHPDRNPGRELEFNSKFQAIQSANEILTDPAQRARYDADRIRSGLFYSYASPTRPNMPPRSPATNYPQPPPRPPPPTATKTNFPPPPTGTNRYTQYTNSEASKSRPNTEGDDAQTKANAFKAWEQMRHGQGPLPTRKVPPRPPRTTFQPRSNASGVPENPPLRRTAPGWEQFQQETQSLPRMMRANTTRVPKKPTHAPSGEVPPAQNKSAYTHVRPDRTHRMSPQYAPPPQPGQRNAEPYRAFRSQFEGEDTLNNSDRISTPYATTGGEKTNFWSNGLGGTANGQERRKSAEWYEKDASPSDTPHPSAHSSTPGRQHHSASPKMRKPKQAPPSPSISSTSSSDESSTPQRAFGTRRDPPRNPATAQPKPILKPSVKVDHAHGGAATQPSYAGLRNSWTDGPRKPQATESFNSDQPEGFLQHRMKRESSRSDSIRRPSLAEQTETEQNKSQHSLHRPKSWNEQYETPKNVYESRADSRPGTSGQTDHGPMYEPSGYSPSPSTPSSHKWAEQWPFMSPKQPRTSSERPPYWAIPSSLIPSGFSPSKKGTDEASEEATRSSFPTDNFADDPFHNDANMTSDNSFSFSSGDPNEPLPRAPPLRSHSSESINTKFSSGRWKGPFTSGKGDFAPPQPPKLNGVSSRASPTDSRPVPPPPPPRQEQGSSMSAPTSGAQFSKNETTTTDSSTAPASRLNPLSTSKEDWAQHFKPATWEYPPSASGSPVKGANRKRAKTPRKYSRIPSKRPQTASVSGLADEHTEDPEAASVESLSSRTSDNESAMDIDPMLTPPSGQSGGEHRSSAQSDRTVIENGRRPGPPVLPRPDDQASNEPQDLNLGDLKNVAPFAPNAEGLKDLKDLNTALPFESKPSFKLPSDPPSKPLEIPGPPKPPLVPATLTQTSWERYLAQMRSYMFEWNTYNSRMLAHFTERKSNVGTLSGDWMSSVGDNGYKQYMQGVQEDFRVRQHWDVSWERHQECMRGLGVVRQKMLGAKNGA